MPLSFWENVGANALGGIFANVVFLMLSTGFKKVGTGAAVTVKWKWEWIIWLSGICAAFSGVAGCLLVPAVSYPNFMWLYIFNELMCARIIWLWAQNPASGKRTF